MPAQARQLGNPNLICLPLIIFGYVNDFRGFLNIAVNARPRQSAAVTGLRSVPGATATGSLLSARIEMARLALRSLFMMYRSQHEPKLHP